MTTFPPTIPIKSLKETASDYNQYAETYRTVADLYQGGSVLRDKVIKSGYYLLQKPKEASEVFRTRQQGFTYTNLLSNVIGWYGSALYKVPAQIVKTRKGVDGDGAAKIPAEAEAFCNAIEKDCDRAGTAFVDFWRKAFDSLMLNRAAYVLIDLPAPDADEPAPASLAEQQKTGKLDPYLVLYTPSQVINWETDRYGNLEWVIIAVANEDREPFKPCVTVDSWYYFDREQVACYQAVRKDEKAGEEQRAELVQGYPRKHAMSDLKQIPVRKVEAPEGLWLANRVFLLLLNHLRLDNGYDFGLFQSAFAQLVISGNFDDSVVMSEVTYLHLPEGTTAEYLEPEGKAYEAIDRRLQSLEERIYKTCYLMDQARSNKSTPTAQSGASKQQDKTPSRDTLAGFGDIIRPAMQLVYSDMLAVRGMDDIVPDVRGFDFEDRADAQDIQLDMQAMAIDINSDTYRHERDKDFAQKRLPDANKELLTKIFEEIDVNPTPEAAAQALLEAQQAQQIDKFSSSFQGADKTAA